MDLYSEELMDEEYFSNELKKKEGFGKGGESYGWPIAVYATPEHLWGYDYVTSAYKEDPEESAKRITKHIMDTYPIATDKQIRNIIGVKPGKRKRNG